MPAYVIDVNVCIVANCGSNQADAKCELSCIELLMKARSEIVCIDAGDHILAAYRDHLSLKGQPGPGDEFMYWLYQNQSNTTVCERVPAYVHSERVFEEFPDDVDLNTFDRADRIYVAVALSSGRNPTIVNAVDSDWLHFDNALAKHGIRLHQLCPQCLKAEKKPGKK